MDEHRAGALESLANPLYLLALTLVATPLVDFLANTWPLRLGEVSWRYGAMGLLSGYVLTPLLGIALMCLLAITLRQRTMLRVLVVVCWVAAIVLVVAAIDFGLDAMQLRNTVPATPPTARWTFDVGAAKAILKHLLGAGALAWFGLATRRVLRSGAAGSARASTPPLVAHGSERGE